MVRPLRPGAREESGVEAGDRQRGDLMGGGDPGAAVDADRDPVTYAQVGEPPTQLIGGQEPAVGSQVVAGRRAHGTGDVPGVRVDRLGLTAVALPRPGIQQHAGPGELGHPVQLDRGCLSGVEDDITRLGAGLTGLQRKSGRLPGLQATVQQPHGVEAGPAQQPPGTGCSQAAGRVVRHHPVPLADPPASGGRLEVGRVGQRVTALGGRPGRSQLGVQRHVDRCGQMPVAEPVVTVRVAERPPDVEQHRRLPAGDLLVQLLGSDQYAHASTLGSSRREVQSGRPGPTARGRDPIEPDCGRDPIGPARERDDRAGSGPAHGSGPQAAPTRHVRGLEDWARGIQEHPRNTRRRDTRRRWCRARPGTRGTDPDDGGAAARAAHPRRPGAVRREGGGGYHRRGDRGQRPRLQAGRVRALRRQGGPLCGDRRPRAADVAGGDPVGHRPGEGAAAQGGGRHAGPAGLHRDQPGRLPDHLPGRPDRLHRDVVRHDPLRRRLPGGGHPRR
ncbi:hypothetical protein SDC9_117780 [bioreactor metagenome]|uniref:Uncharacterized protein n=1 Tax=bioreactor metagenome TaxID=1076179 RepID=A0A645BZP6_9ZZZZ